MTVREQNLNGFAYTFNIDLTIQINKMELFVCNVKIKVGIIF